MPLKGHNQTEEHKRKISDGLKKAYRLGLRKVRILTKAGLEKVISAARLQVGEKHGMWKGDKVGYVALHRWLRRHYGKPDRCEKIGCKYPRMGDKKRLMIKPKRYEWANVSGRYLRERANWMQMCTSCHKIYDLNR